MSWAARWRKRLRTLLNRDEVERELDEEFAFHLEMETQKNLREGMSPEEAKRQAAIAFRGTERFKEEVRDARTLGWVPGWWLDVRLGARMLLKYPGLAVVGTLGMAVAIAIGAGYFTFVHSYFYPTLPLPEGDRVVGIRNWDLAKNQPQSLTERAFLTARKELRSIDHLSAFRTTARSLIPPDGAVSEPVSVAEITASGFLAARVKPLIGRHLLPEDESPSAAKVVVIGYDLWRDRFGAELNVIGQHVLLAGERHTVVGVMPEGFAFPVNHSLWTPLRLGPLSHDGMGRGGLTGFGRLAPGVTTEEAEAEALAVLGRQDVSGQEDTARLRPQVLPYPQMWVEANEKLMFHFIQVLVTLLLVVVAVNVAILVYARTATRVGELAVRSALGASRRRIITQLFAEALVLATAAAALGLILTRVALDNIGALMPIANRLPFWVEFDLSLTTILYVAALAFLGAVIVGIIPGMQATGVQLQTTLRQLGGGTGVQLGKRWKLLVVAQVAFAVALLPGAAYAALDFVRHASVEPGFEAGEFLSAQVVRAPQPAGTPATEEARQASRERHENSAAELLRNLQRLPGVAGVTVASDLPGREPLMLVAIESDPKRRQQDPPRTVRGAFVDTSYLAVLEMAIISGRALRPADINPASPAVVVNRAFSDEFMPERSPLGQRIQVQGLLDQDELGDSEPLTQWADIVGVVENIEANSMRPGDSEARFYVGASPPQIYPKVLLVRARGTSPSALAPQLSTISTEIDPGLQIREVLPLHEVYRREQRGLRLVAATVALVILSVVSLSAAGVYALMSFIVTQRRREIGIRVAVGARPHQVFQSAFRRALRQLGIGVAIGALVGALLDMASGGEMTGGTGWIMIPAVALFVVLVGTLATVGPARRSLQIEPMEALTQE